MENIRSGSVFILGDGNFSFTASFCRRLDTEITLENENSVGGCISVISSVREEKFELLERFPECQQHLRWLEEHGIKLLFGIDATNLDILRDDDGQPLSFDHIIFNFPHTGGKTNLRKSRQLLLDVFNASRSVLSADGRFYLTLAGGQSGLRDMKTVGSTDIPAHNLDSWQPLHLAAQAQLLVENRTPFVSDQWTAHGYTCTGYRNTSRHFHLVNAETLIFRRASISATPDTLDTLQPEPIDGPMHPLRPHYIHDIAFWITDDFRIDLFTDTIRELTRGLVKRIVSLPQYDCVEVNEERTIRRSSLCFRFVWQSIDYAMTKIGARDLMILLRQRLPDELIAKYDMHIQLR